MAPAGQSRSRLKQNVFSWGNPPLITVSRPLFYAAFGKRSSIIHVERIVLEQYRGQDVHRREIALFRRRIFLKESNDKQNRELVRLFTLTASAVPFFSTAEADCSCGQRLFELVMSVLIVVVR